MEFDCAGPSGRRTFALKFAPEFGPDHEVQYVLGVSSDITERKRAEEGLAAAHRQIQSIIDNTTSIVYAFDPQERFLLANTALAELLDSTPEQMIGKRRHEFMPQEDADGHEANDRQVIEAGRAVYRSVYLRPWARVRAAGPEGNGRLRLVQPPRARRAPGRAGEDRQCRRPGHEGPDRGPRSAEERRPGVVKEIPISQHRVPNESPPSELLTLLSSHPGSSLYYNLAERFSLGRTFWLRPMGEARGRAGCSVSSVASCPFQLSTGSSHMKEADVIPTAQSCSERALPGWGLGLRVVEEWSSRGSWTTIRPANIRAQPARSRGVRRSWRIR